MTEKTIIVNDFFGDRRLSKTEFQNRWARHANELATLSWNEDWQTAVRGIVSDVADEAGREFDRLYEAQN